MYVCIYFGSRIAIASRFALLCFGWVRVWGKELMRAYVMRVHVMRLNEGLGRCLYERMIFMNVFLIYYCLSGWE